MFHTVLETSFRINFRERYDRAKGQTISICSFALFYQFSLVLLPSCQICQRKSSPRATAYQIAQVIRNPIPYHTLVIIIEPASIAHLRKGGQNGSTVKITPSNTMSCSCSFISTSKSKLEQFSDMLRSKVNCLLCKFARCHIASQQR